MFAPSICSRIRIKIIVHDLLHIAKSLSLYVMIFMHARPAYLMANVISASHASSPSTVATPLPLPTGPFNRKISTSRCS